MCGIAGYVLWSDEERGAERINTMLGRLAHRGPDDEGVMLVRVDGCGSVDLPQREGQRDSDVGHLTHRIALGHRRLSIIDLSARGHQPMWSAGREVCVALNGELYNYLELREELEAMGRRFRTSSDTEVLLEAFLVWGTEAFTRMNGIWALSLYDARDGSVILARDRIGKIPLYFTRTDRGLFWASEIKALRPAEGATAPEVDAQSVLDFVRSGARDLDERTFYSGIFRFPNASWAKITGTRDFEPQRFWTLRARRRSEADISIAEAAGELRSLLSDAVQIRLRADVPVAFELSGGLDSSTLVAVGSAQGQSVAAYTVSFPGTSMDEAPFAREVVSALGGDVDHRILLPQDADFFANADEYVGLMDEPFHFPGMLTNFQIWQQMHSDGVRVCINGGGGDELFAGYGGEYFRPFIGGLLRRGDLWRAGHELLAYTERRPFSLRPAELHSRLRSAWGGARRFVRGGAGLARGIDPFVPPEGLRPWRGTSPELSQRMVELATDARMNYWLASDNQSYMGVPIEVRMPFLDYRLVEFAFSLPTTYLIRDGWLKWILREAMQDQLPPGVVWRRQKMGFPFPLREWLPQVRDSFFEAAGGAECPYIDLERMRTSYALMARRAPKLLWREMSLLLWWKRCVLGLPLG